MINPLQENFNDIHSKMINTLSKSFNDKEKTEKAKELLFQFITEYNNFCKLYDYDINHKVDVLSDKNEV